MGKWGEYLKKYNPAWEKEAAFKNWLEPSSERDVLQGKPEAHCKLCKIHIRVQKNDLTKHCSSAKHKAKEKNSNRATQPSLHNYAFVEVIDESKSVDLKLAVYVAIHCSLRSMDHLCDILKLLGKGSPLERVRLHRTKCGKLITAVIAPAFHNELIKDIGRSKYSIIGDGATDIGTTKYFGMCVRFFCKRRKKFISDFLGLIEVKRGTGEGLASAVLEYLDSIQLPYMQMESIGVDGENTMCGAHNSFYTHLRDKIPHLQLVKCICHSIDKCAERSYEAIPDEVTYLVTQTCNYFSHSSTRHRDYQKYYKERSYGKEPGKLKSLSATRWLIWYPVSSQVLSQWHELKGFFAEEAEKGIHLAVTLAPLFSGKNLLYLTFLNTILRDVEIVNLAFESTEADVTKLYTDLRDLVYTVHEKKEVVEPNRKVVDVTKKIR